MVPHRVIMSLRVYVSPSPTLVPGHPSWPLRPLACPPKHLAGFQTPWLAFQTIGPPRPSRSLPYHRVLASSGPNAITCCLILRLTPLPHQDPLADFPSPDSFPHLALQAPHSPPDHLANPLDLLVNIYLISRLALQSSDPWLALKSP